MRSDARGASSPPSPSMTVMEFDLCLDKPGCSPNAMTHQEQVRQSPPLPELSIPRHKQDKRRTSVHDQCPESSVGLRNKGIRCNPGEREEAGIDAAEQLTLHEDPRTSFVARSLRGAKRDSFQKYTGAVASLGHDAGASCDSPKACGRQKCSTQSKTNELTSPSSARMARFLVPDTGEALIAYVPETHEATIVLIKRECASLAHTRNTDIALHLIFDSPDLYTNGVLFRALPETWPRSLTAESPLILVKRIRRKVPLGENGRQIGQEFQPRADPRDCMVEGEACGIDGRATWKREAGSMRDEAEKLPWDKMIWEGTLLGSD